MTAQELNFSNFFETTTDGNIGASDTSITLSAAPTSDGTSAITGPFYLVIDPDSLTKREVVLVSSISGVIADVTGGRDVEGRYATDPSHADGTTIRMAVVGEMFKDVNDRVSTIINSDGTAVNTTLFLDEDNMVSDSATKSATQQSIKAYADTKLPLSGGTLTDVTETVQAVTSTSGNVDVDLASGNVATITLTEAVTSIDFTNVPTSGVAVAQLIITQDATSAYGVTLSVTINGGGAVTANTSGNGGFTMSTTLSTIDIVTFLFVNGGTPHVTFLQDMRNS
jgi:hypothetical protein